MWTVLRTLLKQHLFNARWFTSRPYEEGYQSHTFVQDDSPMWTLQWRLSKPYLLGAQRFTWTLLKRLPNQHLLSVKDDSVNLIEKATKTTLLDVRWFAPFEFCRESCQSNTFSVHTFSVQDEMWILLRKMPKSHFGTSVRSNDREKDRERKVYYKRKFKENDGGCYGS